MSTYWIWGSSALGETRRIEVTEQPVIESWGITYTDKDGSKVWRPWERIVKIEAVTELLEDIADLLDSDGGMAAE